MLLFIKVFEENLIAEFSTEFEPLLRRFCIMEAVAAIKFVNEQPINVCDVESLTYKFAPLRSTVTLKISYIENKI